jgi:hypothetical protein
MTNVWLSFAIVVRVSHLSEILLRCLYLTGFFVMLAIPILMALSLDSDYRKNPCCHMNITKPYMSQRFCHRNAALAAGLKNCFNWLELYQYINILHVSFHTQHILISSVAGG